MSRLCFITLLALLLCGCANVEYTAYSGAQQNWPVGRLGKAGRLSLGALFLQQA
jgi:hypothetical protein